VLLRRHCIERLGVRHVLDHVMGINSHDNGDIASLQTKSGGALAGDLFVDCTGMQSLLLGEHYRIGFFSQKHVLFNDCALAVQVPYADENAPIASQTISTAQSNGWIWDIGLPNRRGLGYVYSGSHISDDAAERELRAYIEKSGEGRDIPTPRKLTFRPGYREKFWHRNCVAIGLSAGFIEPLEASALALVEQSASMLSDQMPVTREEMDIVSRRFNESFSYRWERIIDFLKLHYVLTKRTDTAYWRDNCLPESIPGSLRDLLTLWRHLPPSHYDFTRVEELFPPASYQYILYGMGFRTEMGSSQKQAQGSEPAEDYFREAGELTRKMLSGLPTNRELLEHIKRHGMQKI